VTARSRERGSHAGRPRTYGLPFTVPGLTSLGASVSFRHGGRSAAVPPSPATDASAQAEPAVAPEPPAAPWPDAFTPGQVRLPGDGSRVTLPPSGPRPAAPRGNGSRHRKPAGQRSLPVKLPKNARLAAALVVIAGALGIGFADGGFGGAGSPESAVESFLFDWQEAHQLGDNYAQAASLTDGNSADVQTQLAAAYTDLDATNEFFAMQSVTQHGSTAVARYTATVDLAQAGQQWSYTGEFGLTVRNGNWVVDWAPSVINPSLGPGDRLAVETTYAPRAPIVDMNGKSLIAKSTDYRIGVYPGKLKDAAKTADGFSGVTGLDPEQVLGQIQAAPPGEFLALLTLSPSDFKTLWPKLAKVPGLGYQQQSQQLFTSPAQDVVGTVGTENATVLRAEGAAYQPGMTVGLDGFEQTYQDSLVGTPTTTVEVVNAAGHVTKQWAVKGGQAGTPLQTTLNATEQASAVNALATQPNAGEIVAVDSTTGAIRALATSSTSSTGSLSLPKGGPLAAEVEPGMAFSIVSAAALLSTGVSVNLPLPCEPVADVGGVTFTYQPGSTSASTFATDFADGCGTAFANMSRTLSAQQLASTERAFGIGSSWQLQTQSFSGSAPAVSGEGDVAAQVTGAGGVLMSPLSMATVAAEVASGTGHSPVLLPTDSSTSWGSPLSAKGLAELRALMRLAVTSGSAQAANVPGPSVYGQAGVVQSGKHSYLSWFVGYRGTTAVAALETGSTPAQAAAALAGEFLKTVS
jgi:cell division protein FtsI/penicillin-binding protein 2